MQMFFCVAIVTAVVLTVSLSLGYANSTQTKPPVRNGGIKGRLVWAEGEIPKPDLIDVSKSPDARCNSKSIVSKRLVVDPETKGVVDGIAFLVDPVGDQTEARKKLLEMTPEMIIGQTSCEITPHVAVFHEGQIVRFSMKEFSGHSIGLGMSGIDMTPMFKGDPDSQSAFLVRQIRKQDRKIPVKITCAIHYWMEGYILNVVHPFAVVTGADGRFEINDVPAGEQHLIVWHATKGYVNKGKKEGMTVTVKPDEVTDIGEIKLFK